MIRAFGRWLYWRYLDWSTSLSLAAKAAWLLHTRAGRARTRRFLCPPVAGGFAVPFDQVIAIVPVVNWEAELVSELEAFATTTVLHVSPVPFFATRRAWKEYRAANDQRLRAQVSSLLSHTRGRVLVFCYLSDFHVSPATIAFMRRPNVVLVNFNWDDLMHFRRVVKAQPVGVGRICSEFDLNLTFSRRAQLHYIARGAPVMLWKGLRASAQPPTLEGAGTIPRVLFVGAKYGERTALVETLRASGIPVDCFGSGWGTRSLSSGEYRTLVRAYALTIGTAQVGLSKAHRIVKGRDFEVPGFGGLYLTADTPEIRRLYRAGTEILTYRSHREAISVCRAVLATGAPGVRAAGHRRAHQLLRWSSRIGALIIAAQQAAARSPARRAGGDTAPAIGRHGGSA